MSRERLPNELLWLDNLKVRVLCAYDYQDRGIHIYVCSAAGGGNTHWWFDLESKSFWPVSIPSGMEPTSICEYTAADATHSGVMLGCNNAYVRRYHDAQENDDGTTISSYVVYGPFNLGDATGYFDGILMEIVAALGTNSGDVTCTVHVGDTAEDAVNATAFETGITLSEGLNYKYRPRSRGGAACIKLTGTGTAWACERITAVVERMGGGQRKL
jgi:hypothetical protein